MKTILLILGPNGVGKSTAAQVLAGRLPHAALVDSDWCRAMHPYHMETVIDNIYALLKNYLKCPVIETVISPYGFHGDRKKRFDAVINKLRQDMIEFKIYTVILTCSREEILLRAQADQRSAEQISRGMDITYHYYDSFDDPKIDTTGLSVTQTAEMILALLMGR
ncbi:MAG: hypothetical protein SCM11_21250 [Bacillota bacterium]|nr:hypothetical protein [Bacillota bacterium]